MSKTHSWIFAVYFRISEVISTNVFRICQDTEKLLTHIQYLEKEGSNISGILPQNTRYNGPYLFR